MDIISYVLSKKYANELISVLPNIFTFKGTIGTGGTISELPAAAASNLGYAYKVITAGTYSEISVNVGDAIVSNGTSWVKIPEGDYHVASNIDYDNTDSNFESTNLQDVVDEIGEKINGIDEEIDEIGNKINNIEEEIEENALPDKTGNVDKFLKINNEGNLEWVENSGSANIWEGSHAEYEEEKAQIADGTTLLFNDDIGLEAESDYYSEVEQIIGTYMGKPLYRGYFNYGALPSDNFGTFAYKNHGIANIDKITNLCGIVTFADGSKSRLPYSTTTTSATIGIIANSTQVGMLVGMDRHTASAYVFLEYTKTTDSVVGVVGGIKKGDNYSTNEQVIGTWIDGKPLYRKTLTGNLTPSGGATFSEVVSSLSALGASFITKAEGFLQNTEQGGLYNMVTPSYVNSTNASGIYISGTGDIRLYVTGIYQKYYLTLEYTKTTD